MVIEVAKFTMTNAGTCTDGDIQYSYQITASGGIVYTGSVIRHISNSAYAATFTVYTDDDSSTTGNFILTVTAKVGATTTLYQETVKISSRLCGSSSPPLIVWRQSAPTETITYVVGSSVNKEIVIDPATYFEITDAGSPAC